MIEQLLKNVLKRQWRIHRYKKMNAHLSIKALLMDAYLYFVLGKYDSLKVSISNFLRKLFFFKNILTWNTILQDYYLINL